MLLETHDVEVPVFPADRVAVMSAAGRINAIEAVAWPRPRDRAAPAFVALRSTIMAGLGEI
jgi:sulfonate transport system ATP-binding protein